MAVLLLCAPALAAQEPVDQAVIGRIRTEGLDRSHVLDTFNHLVTVIGPRLTNSPAHRRAVDWTEERLRAYGLANVHKEPWEFGRGWTLERFSVEMLEPRYMPLIGYPRGWSPSTNGRLVSAPVYLPTATAESLGSHGGKLQGAIVMTAPIQTFGIRKDRPAGMAWPREALRILKALDVKPRRTVRVALWAGEEQGLLGSRAWVQKHLAGDAHAAAREKFSVYFNLDNGFPPVTGFYLEGNKAMQPIMEAWLEPFADVGATVATLQGIGATDHLSFKAVGVPGFQAVQSYVDYDVRTHHTNVDYERVAPEALKRAAVVMAGVLNQAAMSARKAPRQGA